jgi:hypothetical protein
VAEILGGDKKMDFLVNEQTYFVSLGENPDEWHVFVSTPNGARSIPVYVDHADADSESEESTILVDDKRRRKIVN